jgi:hypothetical protein
VDQAVGVGMLIAVIKRINCVSRRALQTALSLESDVVQDVPDSAAALRVRLTVSWCEMASARGSGRGWRGTEADSCRLKLVGVGGEKCATDQGWGSNPSERASKIPPPQADVYMCLRWPGRRGAELVSEGTSKSCV